MLDTEAQTTLGARPSGGIQLRPCSIDHYSRVEQFTAPGIEGAYRAGLKMIGTPYDFSAIFGILLDRQVKGERRLYCADFIHLCSFIAGRPWLSTRPSNFIAHYTPRDFLLSRDLTYLAG